MMICSDSDHQPEVSSNKKRLFMLEYLLNIFIRPCPLCSGFCTTVHHRAQRWEFAICACTIVPRHFCTPPFTNSQVQFWTNLGQLTLYLSRSSTVLGWSFNSYAWEYFISTGVMWSSPMMHKLYLNCSHQVSGLSVLKIKILTPLCHTSGLQTLIRTTRGAQSFRVMG